MTWSTRHFNTIQQFTYDEMIMNLQLLVHKCWSEVLEKSTKSQYLFWIIVVTNWHGHFNNINELKKPTTKEALTQSWR